MNVQYDVQRNVAVSTVPDGPITHAIAMVIFQMPGELVTRLLAIPEELIKAEGKGTRKGENEVILHELELVINQMTAGATGDLMFTKQ